MKTYTAYSNTAYKMTDYPDALFDIRSGLIITDSQGGESISIKDFPYMMITEDTDGNLPPWENTYGCPESADVTAVFFVLPQQATDNYSDIRNIAGNTNNYIRIYNATKALVAFIDSNFISVAFPDAANYTTNLYMIVWTFNSLTSVFTIRIYNTSTNYNENTRAASSLPAYTAMGIKMSKTSLGADMGWLKYYYYNRTLSDAELTNVWNNTASSTSLSGYSIINHGEALLSKCWDSGGDSEFTVLGATGALPVLPWYLRCNLSQASDNLLNGYTQRGPYQIAYKPSMVKGITAIVDDMECIYSDVIHNLADSRIYFNTITDATIKAIFDKSNSTYWNASIQSEDHYIDAGGGYYGVWHPLQLNRIFIEAHAKAGHENHIFPGLRWTSNVISGITKIAVYKTNISG